MPKPGPRTTYKYSDQFKATAVRLSQLPDVAVRDVAEACFVVSHLGQALGLGEPGGGHCFDDGVDLLLAEFFELLLRGGGGAA